MENSNLEFNKEAKNASLKQKSKFSLTSIFIVIAIIAAIVYIYAMLFGERSIFVLNDDKNRLEKLNNEYNTLQNQNQKLQKKYFELIQLTPDEDDF